MELNDKVLQPTLCDVEYLEASAGWGKTYTTLKHLSGLINTKPSFSSVKKYSNYIYVGKGIQLCDESSDLMQEFYSGGTYIVCHNEVEELPKRIVFDSVKYYLESKQFDMLFITHGTFLKCLNEGIGDMFSGCSIVIDEYLEVFSLDSIRVSKRDDKLLPYLKLDEDKDCSFLSRADAFKKRLRKDESSTSEFREFVDFLSKGTRCYEKFEKEYKHYTGILTYDIREVLLHVDRCIIMGARIKDTLSSCLWENSGVRLREFNDVTLPRDSYPNMGRVDIYYLTHEHKRPNGCSKTLLETLYNPLTGLSVSPKEYKQTKYGVDSYPEYKYVIEEFIDRSLPLLGEDFIYTVNKWVGSSGYTPDNGVRVPYACHGWNNLKHHTTAAAWFTYKPAPSHEEAMIKYGREINFPSVVDKYIDDKHKEPSLQILGRSAIRDHEQPDVPLTWVVVDRNVAEYIVNYHLPEANIRDDIALQIPDKRVNNGGHNKAFAEEHFSGDKSGKNSYYSEVTKYKKDHNGESPSEDYLLEWKDKFLGKRKRNAEKANRTK